MLIDHPYLFGIAHWIVSAMALMLTAAIVKNFEVGGFFSAMIAAFVIAAANYFVRPFLLFLTFPLNIVTLGFFTFVINGAILKLCALILPGFAVKTWSSAIFGAIILSIVSLLLHMVLV